MEREIEGVTRLLEEAGKVLKDIDKKMSEGAGFNVFRLCGVDHYETMHSKILAEFLNPQGSHGQRTLFLKYFQKLLKDHFKFKGEFSDRTSVTTEFSFGNGRLDILIEDESNKSVCVIENKIFASEQPEQLERYAEWLRKERKGWDFILIFLTLNGRDACSIKGQKRYYSMAYVSECDKPCLEKWIDDCCKGLRGNEFVRCTLEQYKKHIINLSKGEHAMKEALIKLIKKEAAKGVSSMAAAETICRMYDAIKWDIITDLMKEVKIKIENEIRAEKEFEINVSLDPVYDNKEPGCAFCFGNEDKIKLWCAWNHKDDLRLLIGLNIDYFSSKAERTRFNKWRNERWDQLIKRSWEECDDEYWSLFKWLIVGGCNESPEWNGEFLDKMMGKSSIRKVVVDTITRDLKELFELVCEFRRKKQ